MQVLRWISFPFFPTQARIYFFRSRSSFILIKSLTFIIFDGSQAGFYTLIFSQSIPLIKGWSFISLTDLAPNLLEKSLFSNFSIKSLAYGDIMPSSVPTSGHSIWNFVMLSITSSIEYPLKGRHPINI